jgi:hypothetical protein
MTERLSAFGRGKTRAVFRTEFGPVGHRLDPPVTIVFSWEDLDNDGNVDGFDPPLAERDLRVWRNGLQVAGRCRDPRFQSPACTTACCDTLANTWTLQVDAFGQYVVADSVEMLIPGTGGLEPDCALEWEVLDPRENPPVSKKGLPNPKRTCLDGDPLCDADGQANGECTLLLRACVNVEDPRLRQNGGSPLCVPSEIEAVILRSPRPSDRKPWKAEAANTIGNLLSSLGASTMSGLFRPLITYTPPVASEVCTARAAVVIPIISRDRQGLRIGTKTLTNFRKRRDLDRLVLTCVANR